MLLRNILLLATLATLASLCSAQMFYRRPFPVIRPPTINYGSNSDKEECCDDKTITVGGSATVQADPDQVTITAEIKASSKTTEQAVSSLTSQVDSIIAILNSNGLTQDNYKVTSFRTYANSSWNNGVKTILGYIASQSFQIVLPSIQPDGSNIGQLFDSLAAVNGITLNGLSFDLSDKTVVYQQARELAFQNAKEKAKDYVDVLGVLLSGVASIKDSFSSAPSVVRSNEMMSLVQSDSPVSTTVNVGTIPISYQVEVVYKLSY